MIFATNYDARLSLLLLCASPCSFLSPRLRPVHISFRVVVVNAVVQAAVVIIRPCSQYCTLCPAPCRTHNLPLAPPPPACGARATLSAPGQIRAEQGSSAQHSVPHWRRRQTPRRARACISKTNRQQFH